MNHIDVIVLYPYDNGNDWRKKYTSTDKFEISRKVNIRRKLQTAALKILKFLTQTCAKQI